MGPGASGPWLGPFVDCGHFALQDLSSHLSLHPEGVSSTQYCIFKSCMLGHSPISCQTLYSSADDAVEQVANAGTGTGTPGEAPGGHPEEV